MQTVTIPQALEIGLHHHRAGRLADAEAIYRQILAQEPNHAAALHLLGAIAQQAGRHDIAVDLMRRAIAANPSAADYHSNLGVALDCSGQLEEAIAAFRRAIEIKPDYAAAHNNLGNALRKKGRTDEAMAAFRNAIRFDPDSPTAHNNLGNAFKDQGRLDEAIAACLKALDIKPDYTDAQFNLGNALRDKGRPEEAIDAYRAAIAIQPDFVAAHVNLGNLLVNARRLEEAVAVCRRAIALKPDLAAAHNSLGNALKEMGRADEAIAMYRRAIEIDPGLVEALNNLGNALTDDGLLDEAITAFRKAIAIKPDYAESHNNLGNALAVQGRLGEAIDAYRRAAAIKPDFVEAHVNLGNMLMETGDLNGAIAACRRAIEIQPDFAGAHNNLGNALRELGRLEDAIAEYRIAIENKPDSMQSVNNLGVALTEQGRLGEAIAEYRRALQCKPDDATIHSNLLLFLHNQPECDARATFEEHRRWDERHARPLAKSVVPHGNDRDPGRRLRIGYVSSDFREHSVAFFFEGLLAAHDRGQVEVFCYADGGRSDRVTVRLQKCAGNWRRIAGMKDAQVAGLVRKDGIDILVDLAGHTASNRLLVFARKPAPVQVTSLGYPDTTGMSAMAYRLTDMHADPPGMTDHLHSEQLVRLPEVFACFRPAEESPPVSPLPALERGHITFASFHSLAKLHDRILEWWAEILLQVPGSRLLMVATGLDEAPPQRRLSEFFAGKGLAPERLTFKTRQSLPQYLALHHEADLMLDSHPYSGHTIACHALWMGVPIVTLAGDRHCSRMVASVLTSLGLADLIATTPEEYVKSAIELAGNLPRLAELRSTLRERMRASPLTDAPRFAREIEHAYRRMWQAWCATPP